MAELSFGAGSRAVMDAAHPACHESGPRRLVGIALLVTAQPKVRYR